MFLQETVMSHLHICRNRHLFPSPYRQALTGRRLQWSAHLESLGNSQTFLMDVHAPHLSLLPELCAFFHVFGVTLTMVSTTTFPEVNMLKAKDMGSRLHSLSPMGEFMGKVSFLGADLCQLGRGDSVGKVKLCFLPVPCGCYQVWAHQHTITS